jgi:hypothetical protein
MMARCHDAPPWAGHDGASVMALSRAGRNMGRSDGLSLKKARFFLHEGHDRSYTSRLS